MRKLCLLVDNGTPYGRHGSPTTDALIEAISELEGARGNVLCPTGLSACTTAIMVAVSTGDHLLLPDSLYVSTRYFCETFCQRFGVEISYYGPCIGAGIESEFRPNTRAFDDEKREAVAATSMASRNTGGSSVSKPSIPYRFNGYTKFLDSNGYPAIKPPWGTLTAINLNTGRQVWQTTLGEITELTKQGIPPTGTENYGGPVVTAGGLLFIAATKDGMFRAYDKTNGKLLWQVALPAAGFATPSTYSVRGKQYVVVACGGNKLGARKGDSYITFVLPD